MALQVNQWEMSFRDAKGWIGKTRGHVTVDDAGADPAGDVSQVVLAIKNAIIAITNAAYQGETFGLLISPPTLTYGTNAQYPAEWMKVWMQFSTDLGTIHRFKIPAPKIAIMDTDGVTVKNDGTVATVVAYVNAMKGTHGDAYSSTATGLALTHFEGGLVRLGAQPKRFNERVKSAGLVAGEGE